MKTANSTFTSQQLQQNKKTNPRQCSSHIQLSIVPGIKKSEMKRLGDINNNLQTDTAIQNSEHNFLYIKPIITINPVGL